MRLAVFVVLAGCAHPKPQAAPDGPTVRPADQTRHYTIWLGGARVGTAIESERWHARGMTLTRDERLRFLRGDAVVELATAIAIDADTGLDAQRVRWTETGSEVRSTEAVRDGGGWRLSTGATIESPAVPAELVPLLVRRDGEFAGPIFLPARGFVTGAGRVDPIAADRLVARLSLDAGPVVEATIDLGADGAPARVVDGDGVIAIRASEAQARAPFEVVDLIAATAIPIAGDAPPRGAARRLVLDGDLALPAVPGQLAHPTAGGIAVELSPALSGALPAGDHSRERTREIEQLVGAVRARITPDLGTGPASARDADTATAGDCTTFALAYASLAASRGIATRIVTGLRVDGGRLIRHRWAVSWTGARWIAIDAAFGHAPAGGNLIGLAIHEADDAGLVAGEAALAQVRTATWAR